MKANLENIQKIYLEIPNTWINDGVRTDNYSQAETHYADGWRDVVIPEIGQFQKLSDQYILINDVVTKEVIDLTEQEIRDLTIPQQITSMKFFLGLLELGITRSMIYAGINDDTEFGLTELEKAKLIEVIRTATDFKRNDARLIMLAPKFGVTDLDAFFIMCNSIPTS